MSNLFTKAAVFTDIHLGKSNNSIQHNQDCLDYIKWFIEQGQLEDCDTAIFCGDWHHNRSTTNSLTLQHTLKCLELLNMSFPQTYFIVGNHDLYYKSQRDVSSVAFAQYLPNIKLINEITTVL
jgi:DNA repair exonuclease SbcCD nuclease subunit